MVKMANMGDLFPDQSHAREEQQFPTDQQQREHFSTSQYSQSLPIMGQKHSQPVAQAPKVDYLADKPSTSVHTPADFTLQATAPGSQELQESLQKADDFLAQLHSESTEIQLPSNTIESPHKGSSISSVSPEKDTTMKDIILSNANNNDLELPSIFHAKKALRAIEEGRRIFVGNLNVKITAKSLAKLFKGCEESSTVLVPTKNGRGAFVSYPSEAETRSAVAQFDGAPDRHGGGLRYYTKIVRPIDIHNTNERASASCREGRRIYIGNLDPATTEIALADFFKDYALEMISIPRDQKTDHFLGFALVSMLSVSDAESAIGNLSGKTLLKSVVSIRSSRATPAEANSEAQQAPAQSLTYRPAPTLGTPMISADTTSKLQMSAPKLLTIDDREAGLVLEAELKQKAQRSLQLHRNANPPNIIRPANNVATATATITPAPNPQVSDAKCGICSGKHVSFAPECRYKQDYYEVARKLEEKLGGIYTGPKCFQNWSELLRYDVNDRPRGPIIRWPFPKELARLMTDEQFSIVLLDALSYTLPTGVLEQSQIFKQTANIVKKEKDTVSQASSASEVPAPAPQRPQPDLLQPQRLQNQGPQPQTLQPQGTLMSERPENDNKIRCPNCDSSSQRVFSDITALKQHLVVSHPAPCQGDWAVLHDSRSLRCTFCAEVFNASNIGLPLTRIAIAQHVALVHPNEVAWPPVAIRTQSHSMKRKNGDGDADEERKRAKIFKQENDNERAWDIDTDRRPRGSRGQHRRGSRGRRRSRSSRSPIRIRDPSVKAMRSRMRSRSPIRLPPTAPRQRSRSPMRLFSADANVFDRQRSPLRRQRSRSPVRLSSGSSTAYGKDLTSKDEAEYQKWRRDRVVPASFSSSSIEYDRLESPLRIEERRREPERKAPTPRRLNERDEYVRESESRRETARRLEDRREPDRRLLEPGLDISRFDQRGKYFEDRIGGSYYNGTAISIPAPVFRNSGSHYSPPLGPTATRIKQEKTEHARIEAIFGKAVPPKGPRSMARDFNGSGSGNLGGFDGASGMEMELPLMRTVTVRGGGNVDSRDERERHKKKEGEGGNVRDGRLERYDGRLERDWTED